VRIACDTISIRIATPDDTVALARLAALDSGFVPSGPILLAERDGNLHAALGLSGTGAVIADPFVPTVELVALLRVRAARLAGGADRRRARRFGRKSRAVAT
jgi:hypothetical protein